MKLCRFQYQDSTDCVGLVQDSGRILDLSFGGIKTITSFLEGERSSKDISVILNQSVPQYDLNEITLLPPVERQEVWAAGVTYLRSKTARMEESDFSATAYDRVYDAARPELFFKSLPEKVVPTAGEVGIRKDAKWSVPEPELALVINSEGKVAGFSIGNDMSSRDIEGENLLYLPQAKVYDRSCSVGPWIRVGVDESDVREWGVKISIDRKGTEVFSAGTKLSQIKRTFEELADYLCRSQTFPHGAVLLTGTGIVPPDEFTLEAGDRVKIQISGIGDLVNTVTVV